MISSFFLKPGARRKWIFVTAVAWTIGLALVARGTAKLRQRDREYSVKAQRDLRSDESNTRLQKIQQENSRMHEELKKLPDLNAEVAELKKKAVNGEEKEVALWASQSSTLQAAIEQKQRELAEVGQWSSEWQKAKQREAAEARLEEKAKEAPADSENEYTRTKETLRKLALARKRLVDIRKEWAHLEKSEKDKFRPRLQAALEEWTTANNVLGEDHALYQDFPLNSDQDAASVLMMRSIIPDRNGMLVSVFLDGTVNISKANEAN